MQGIGYDVLAGILQAVRPTHVVLLQTGNPTKDLPAAHFWQSAAEPSGAALLTLPALAAPGQELPGTALCLSSFPSVSSE